MTFLKLSDLLENDNYQGVVMISKKSFSLVSIGLVFIIGVSIFNLKNNKILNIESIKTYPAKSQNPVIGDSDISNIIKNNLKEKFTSEGFNKYYSFEKSELKLFSNSCGNNMHSIEWHRCQLKHLKPNSKLHTKVKGRAFALFNEEEFSPTTA